MSGDRRRDPPKQGVGSRSSSSQRGASQGDVNPWDDRTRAGESEAPTRPRGRTIPDSESPSDSRPSVSTPSLRAAQDSFHPVRVPARTVRPPMSLWARAWGTIALVIVVAGGAVGIVTSLRARTIGAAQQAHGDGWQAASAAQGAPEKRTEAMDAIRAPSAPAAAPGIAAPAPVVPSPAASRSGASSADAVTAAPVGSSADSVGPRAPPSAVVFRTTDSLAVSPPVGSATALSLARRNKPAVETTTQPKTEPGPPLEEPAHQPAPAPAASDAPATTDESEAWVTEERRF